MSELDEAEGRVRFFHRDLDLLREDRRALYVFVAEYDRRGSELAALRAEHAAQLDECERRLAEVTAELVELKAARDWVLELCQRADDEDPDDYGWVETDTIRKLLGGEWKPGKEGER